MRVLLLGMRGASSRAVLDALLAAGHVPCAVALPAARDAPFALRRLSPPPAGMIALDGPTGAGGIVELAWERGLPALELARLAAPETLAALAALRPDVACVACWPRRIPAALLELPAQSFLNVHPSLLPAYRGPEPLFWTLRDGAPAGVTVHVMDADLDTGAIVAQAAVDLPDGIAAGAAELRCAEVGGALLADALGRLAAGELPRRPQPPGGSRQSFPSPADFTIEAGWSARRAFNFMRGAAAWGEPFALMSGGERLLLRAAISYQPGARLGAPHVCAGERVQLQLADGVLVALAEPGA